MIKKILFLMALVMPVLSFATNRFIIQNSVVTVPDTGKLYILMQNDVPVNGFNFIVQFDSSVITPLNIRPAGRITFVGGAGSYHFVGDKISFVMFGYNGKSISAGVGRVFEIEYTVDKKALGKKVTTTQVTFYQGIVADSARKVMSFDYVNSLITINDSTVAVAERPSQLPVRFELSQNYPNPFNPTTVIGYALPAASNVSLRIYDIVGREVRTLVDEVQSAGYKTIEWDARNNVGLRVATGIYFYRIEAKSLGNTRPAFVQVKQMLLLK